MNTRNAGGYTCFDTVIAHNKFFLAIFKSISFPKTEKENVIPSVQKASSCFANQFCICLCLAIKEKPV